MTRRFLDEHAVVQHDAGPLYRPEWPLLNPSRPDGNSSHPFVPIAAYWTVFFRNRWTVITVVAVVTTLVAIASFRMKPVYQATSRVAVDSETPLVQSLQDMYQQMPTDEDFLRTQAQVLESDQLAWRTVEQLGLAENPAFTSSATSRAAVDPNTRKMRLIGEFKDQLNVALVPSSRILRVRFESTDPQLAARVANGLVDNYVDFNFREKYDATRQASGRMEQQLDELKMKVEKSQQALVEYQREHAIANISDKQNVVGQRLGELSSDLTKAQSDRFEKEALYNTLRADPSQIAAVAQNELLQRFQERYADLNNQYVEAANQYGPSFPKVQRLQKQTAEIDVLIQKERSRVLAKISSDYTTAKGREALLVRVVEKQKDEVASLNKLLVEQNMLSGEFESNQKMYQTLLQRLKDATVSAGLRATNIHVIDPALPPIDPVRPKKIQNICFAAFGGLLLSFLIIVVREGLDYSVKTSDDAEAILDAPTVAIVPASIRPSARLLKIGNGHPANAREAIAAHGIAILQQPRSPIAEAYRALRTAVLLAFNTKTQRTLLITSANSGEGKTSTATNLALSMAERGQSVLLMDCDLRRPAVAKVLNLDNRKGVCSVLSGKHTVQEVTQQFPAMPKLSVIVAGPIAHGPAELLSTDTMSEFLQEVSQHYDFVIIDSPPILAVTDASILACLVDGVLVVVESGVTPRKAVAQMRRLIDYTGAKLIGLVLNKIDSRHGEYYGYYSGYYRYGDVPHVTHAEGGAAE